MARPDRAPLRRHNILPNLLGQWRPGHVDALIAELEKEFFVLPAFCFGMGDKDLGAWSNGEVAERFFMGRIDALINLQPVFRSRNMAQSIETLKQIGCSCLSSPHGLP